MAVLASDSFNRADNASTMGSTDSSSGGTSYAWSSATTYGILSNQAQKKTGSASANSSATIDPGVANCAVTITFAVLGNNSRLVFRSIDDTNLWYIKANGTTNYQIIKRVSSSNTVAGTISIVPANGDIIKAVCNGTSITVTVNGANSTSVTDSFNQTATRVGILTDDTVARLDNFLVEDLGAGTTTFTGSGTSSGTTIVSAAPIVRKQSSGTASGISQVTGTSILRKIASGTSIGIATTFVNIGIVTYHMTGVSNGSASTIGTSQLRKQAAGNSLGKASVSVGAVLRLKALGIANGSSWTSTSLGGGNSNNAYYYQKNYAYRVY